MIRPGEVCGVRSAVTARPPTRGMTIVLAEGTTNAGMSGASVERRRSARISSARFIPRRSKSCACASSTRWTYGSDRYSGVPEDAASASAAEFHTTMRTSSRWTLGRTRSTRSRASRSVDSGLTQLVTARNAATASGMGTRIGSQGRPPLVELDVRQDLPWGSGIQADDLRPRVVVRADSPQVSGPRTSGSGPLDARHAVLRSLGSRLEPAGGAGLAVRGTPALPHRAPLEVRSSLPSRTTRRTRAREALLRERSPGLCWATRGGRGSCARPARRPPQRLAIAAEMG